MTATQTATPAGPTAGARTAPGRRWTLAGTALFVAGFSALFASYGAAFGGLGEMLLSHQRGLVHATPLGRS